jgi:hypothetical protein
MFDNSSIHIPSHSITSFQSRILVTDESTWETLLSPHPHHSVVAGELSFTLAYLIYLVYLVSCESIRWLLTCSRAHNVILVLEDDLSESKSPIPSSSISSLPVIALTELTDHFELFMIRCRDKSCDIMK